MIGIVPRSLDGFLLLRHTKNSLQVALSLLPVQTLTGFASFFLFCLCFNINKAFFPRQSKVMIFSTITMSLFFSRLLTGCQS